MNTNEILEFWFANTNKDSTNCFWFDKSQDQYIIEKYKLSINNKITHINNI